MVWCKEEIRKKTGFVFSIRIPWFEKWQDSMLQIFSNRTNSKQEKIRIPCRPQIWPLHNACWTSLAIINIRGQIVELPFEILNPIPIFKLDPFITYWAVCISAVCQEKSPSKLAKLDDFPSFTELHDHGAGDPLLQVQCTWLVLCTLHLYVSWMLCWSFEGKDQLGVDIWSKISSS